MRTQSMLLAHNSMFHPRGMTTPYGLTKHVESVIQTKSKYHFQQRFGNIRNIVRQLNLNTPLPNLQLSQLSSDMI